MQRRSNEVDAANTAAVFAALGDASRLQLLSRLSAEGPLTTSRMVDGCSITRQAVSKHLAVLARAGLVQGSRRGRERFWILEPRGLIRALRLLEQISSDWDERLERLRRYVEG